MGRRTGVQGAGGSSDLKKLFRLEVVDCELYPREESDATWPASFEASDHRPLTATFRFVPITLG
jgi:hypothetical protein